MKEKLLSVIVPCFNEEDAIPIFYKEFITVLNKMKDKIKYELIFIDDGSKDDTLNNIKKLSEKDTNVKFISFSRNFGKEAAMYAGFCNVNGDFVAVMDVDLQDPPSLLPRMFEILETGNYDSVATRRGDREGEPPIRSYFARKFYKIINKISDVDIVDGARDFRLMKKNMVDAIVKINENNRFSKGIFEWVGFNTYWLSYKNIDRVAGKTKWNFWKLFKYALDGIINFSETPLNISSFLGIGMTFVSFIFLVFLILRKIIFGDPVAGWVSTVSIIIFVSGIQMFCIGIMGQYIARIYKESKNRPHYIVSQSNIDSNKLK